MTTRSLRVKILLPLLIGGLLMSLTGSWLIYQAALDELRTELLERGRVLGAALNQAFSNAPSDTDVRFAVEQIVQHRTGVSGITIATKDPLTIWASSFHPGVDLDRASQDMLQELEKALELGRFGHHFGEDGDLVVVMPLASAHSVFRGPDALEEGTAIRTALEAEMPRGVGSMNDPDPVSKGEASEGYEAVTFVPDSQYKGAIYLRFDWDLVQRESRRLLWHSVSIMLAGLAVIMLLTLYLVNRVILKQVYAIGRAIRAQEEGNRDVRVASPTSDEIGKVAGAFNHMVDSLHKSQELFSRVFHASPTLFAISRPDGRGHYDVNEAWTATLGYQRDEAMTHSAVELGVWIDAKEHTRFMERLEGEGSVRDFETKFRTKSGKEIDVLVAGEYMKLGGERHLLEVSHDLTGRKAMEARLHQAQKMEAVGQLTGGVAHDFNNLLAVIMGNVGLLENQLGTEDDSLREILRASTRGAELTQRLLAFSRRQPLRPRSVDLCDLVAGMENLLTRTLGETIDISITSNTGLWKAMVDGSQLESAILNLAINARDAMPSGGKLGIETANVTLNEGFASSNLDVSPGNYVMLAVSDTGTGMAPNVLNRALEPFFTTKDVGMGSGLGLSMVYGLVKQSGGDLTIRSKKGQGTTVMLYLPTAGDEAEAGQTEHEARAEVPRGQGETVLVVEDDPAVRSVTKSLLESLGYRVLTAEDGRSGLDTLGMAPSVCLLLSDVVLPGGMDGPSLANEAKRQLPHLKVLFMSGYAESLVRGRSQLHDGDDLVNKPFHREGLAQRVRAALDR